MLNAWCERPLTTSAVFVIPRILQHQWRGLSRHLLELATYDPWTLPVDCQPVLPIPFVILYLGPHVRTLPDPYRMDGPPLPLRSDGIGNRPGCCAGCRLMISRAHKAVICTFHSQPFSLPQSGSYRACGTAYHVECLRVGLPFTTRLRQQQGLAFPSVDEWPNFVCEACTVRAVLQRELQDSGPDLALLMLERMRLIDMANHWSLGTHREYQPLLRQLRRFGTMFGVPLLDAAPLKAPPATEDIALMWAHEYSSVQPKQVPAHRPGSDAPKNYKVLKNLRSAASYYHAWDAMISDPRGAYLDPKSGKVSHQRAVRATDSLAFTFFASGMSTRLGTESKQSVALLPRHVISLDQWLEHQFSLSTTDAERHEWALAGVTNVGLWTSWARSVEWFNLRWCDIEVTLPADGPIKELPRGIGALELALLPATKSSRTVTADLAVAYTCASGLSLGRWLTRAWQTRPRDGAPQDWSTCSSYILQHRSGRRWSSYYFRTTFCIPTFTASVSPGILRLFPLMDPPRTIRLKPSTGLFTRIVAGVGLRCPNFVLTSAARPPDLKLMNMADGPRRKNRWICPLSIASGLSLSDWPSPNSVCDPSGRGGGGGRWRFCETRTCPVLAKARGGVGW